MTLRRLWLYPIEWKISETSARRVFFSMLKWEGWITQCLKACTWKSSILGFEPSKHSKQGSFGFQVHAQYKYIYIYTYSLMQLQPLWLKMIDPQYWCFGILSMTKSFFGWRWHYIFEEELSLCVASISLDFINASHWSTLKIWFWDH